MGVRQLANSKGSGQGQGQGQGRVLIFENRKYSEEDFVIPAQDTKGHSERIFFRVQPGTMRDLKVIMSSRKFPFRTVGDIGRLATKMIVELLQSMEAMPSVSGQVDAIIRIVRDEELHLEFMGLFEQMGKTINRYIGAGEEAQARRMLAMIKDEVKAMPRGYWRSKYWKEINTKYGHLMKNSGAGLGQLDGDDDEGDGYDI